MSSRLDPRLADVLGKTVTMHECAVDEQSLRRGACDAFFEGTLPLAVLTPGSTRQLSAWVPRLAAAGIAIVPRGSSLSYSGGTIGPAGPWIALDLRALNRVVEVNPTDRFVRVEAGCTWSALREALAAYGLRTPFWGPSSGLHATIGGSLAVDAIFLGSACHGSATASVLGLTALLADGQLLRTGVSSSQTQTFAHPFGPDLTRLYLGSCGAFGLIIEATLRVIENPTEVRFAGFLCDNAAVSAVALRNLASANLASEAVLLDPAATAAMGQALDSHALVETHALSIALEGNLFSEVEGRLSRAKDACSAAGAQYIGEGVLRALRDRPFGPPTMLLDANGRRWVPVHGIVLHSQVLAALGILNRCMAQHADLVDELNLEWNCTCALIGSGAVLVEIHLYWHDAGNALIQSYLGATGLDAGVDSRWRRVEPLRVALAESLDEIGATHLHIGRFYRYLSRLEASSRALLTSLKAALDPHSVMNPGALGLGESPNGAGCSPARGAADSNTHRKLDETP